MVAIQLRECLDKQLSLGQAKGFSLNKDPRTGAAIEPPIQVHVYTPGTKFPPSINSTERLGPGVEDLSLSVGKIGFAQTTTGAVFVVSKGEFNGNEIDYIENTTVTRGWAPAATLRLALDNK